MITHRYILLCVIFLISYSISHSQITLQAQPSDHNHEPSDSTYSCGICDGHLFDSDEVTDLGNGELHYHGIGTANAHSLFQCAACNGHLGVYDHEHQQYQLLNENVTLNDAGVFVCTSCNLPLFDQGSLLKSDDSFLTFKQPVKSDRINLDKTDKFYKVSGPESTLSCKACNGSIGGALPSIKGGFGLRINLSKVKKKPRAF